MDYVFVKIWLSPPGIEPGPSEHRSDVLSTRPQRRRWNFSKYFTQLQPNQCYYAGSNPRSYRDTGI